MIPSGGGWVIFLSPTGLFNIFSFPIPTGGKHKGRSKQRQQNYVI